MKRLLPLLLVVAAGCVPALAQSYYFSPDVPTDDPAAAAPTYLPWEIVRNDAGAYGSTLTLPAGTAIDALHLMNGGDWLFSVEAPTDLGGTTYDPRDVIRFNGLSYSTFFNGAAQGVPAGSDVDAVFLDGGDNGTLVISFDVPTTIGAATYDPADLVKFAAGVFSLYFDASAATPPIPTTSNVTGADERHGKPILTFDVPTTLGGMTYMPGELVEWDATAPGFIPFYADPNWPITSRADGFCFLATPGLVPPTIQVDKSSIAPGDLTISWSVPTCTVGAEDYGIYEGTLASLASGSYDHRAIDCNDGGTSLTEEVTPGAGDRYYLVVPNNPNDEGSYGTDYDFQTSASNERPAGLTPPPRCQPTQDLGPCP